MTIEAADYPDRSGTDRTDNRRVIEGCRPESDPLFENRQLVDARECLPCRSEQLEQRTDPHFVLEPPFFGTRADDQRAVRFRHQVDLRCPDYVTQKRAGGLSEAEDFPLYRTNDP